MFSFKILYQQHNFYLALPWYHVPAHADVDDGAEHKRRSPRCFRQYKVNCNLYAVSYLTTGKKLDRNRNDNLIIISLFGDYLIKDVCEWLQKTLPCRDRNCSTEKLPRPRVNFSPIGSLEA